MGLVAVPSVYKTTSQAFKEQLFGLEIWQLAHSDPRHPGIMAFMSADGDYYTENATDLFSSWTNASKIDDAALWVAIMDQPICKIAQMNKASYACGGTDSVCTNAPDGGYTCYCPQYDDDINPYLSDECMQVIQQGVPCLLFSMI